MSKEKTGGQVLSQSTDGSLVADTKTNGAAWYRKVRKMRKHPTVALARELVVAPVLASQWGVESTDSAPDGAKEFIDGVMQPLRIELLRTSMFGCIDYGWQPYEKVFELDQILLQMVPDKIKPLLQDITEILVEPKTGAFAGFSQEGTPNVVVPLEDSLLVNIDVEGTYWYGQSKMENVEVAYDDWTLTNDANRRYDKKLAGAHWIIYYPVGETGYNGELTNNDLIAKDLMNRLQSSGTVAVPTTVDDFVNNANDSSGRRAWEIEIKSAYPTSNVAFIDRLKYLDAMMARALGMPERGALEGQFGTKAEAEAHADFAITNMELRHLIIVQQYNKYIVNPLLYINYGREFKNTVFIKPAPITDLKINYLRSVYSAFLANESVLQTELTDIDMNALRDQLGVPTMSTIGRKEQDVKDANQTMLSFVREFKFAEE